jgi:hypothetical protein
VGQDGIQDGILRPNGIRPASPQTSIRRHYRQQGKLKILATRKSPVPAKKPARKQAAAAPSEPVFAAPLTTKTNADPVFAEPPEPSARGKSPSSSAATAGILRCRRLMSTPLCALPSQCRDSPNPSAATRSRLTTTISNPKATCALSPTLSNCASSSTPRATAYRQRPRMIS